MQVTVFMWFLNCFKVVSTCLLQVKVSIWCKNGPEEGYNGELSYRLEQYIPSWASPIQPLNIGFPSSDGITNISSTKEKYSSRLSSVNRRRQTFRRFFNFFWTIYFSKLITERGRCSWSQGCFPHL